MTEFPDWTAFTSDETYHRGLDPLGLAAVGSRIVQRRLLPGITDATRHIRYYSFFCWVFWTFWQNGKRGGRLSEQRNWRARLENIMRAASLWGDPNIVELVGRRKTIRLADMSPNAKIRIDNFHVVSAFIPAFYSSSFRALGCGKWTTDRGAQLTVFGEELAKTFDFGMRGSAASRVVLPTILTTERTITVKAVRIISEAIRIRAVQPVEREHSLLLELLFRLKTGSDQISWQARSRSFALLMEIVEQAQGTILSDNDFHRVFATSHLPNKRNFIVPVEFLQDFEIWKRYQERQYVKLSIYSFWHEVIQILDYRPSKTASVQQMLSHFRGALGKSSVVLEWFGRGCLRLNLGEVQELLRRRLRAKPHEFGNSAMALTETLMDIKRTSSERVGTAIVLLLFVSSYWTESQKQLKESQLHREGGRSRLSLQSVATDVGHMGSFVLPDYLQWIVENYVFKQATKIAVEKLPDYRYFIVRDDNGYRLVKKQNPFSYLSYDPSRIQSAFALMSELNLIHLSQGYRLTRAGRIVLQQLRAHHSHARTTSPPEN
jgi:hypothetical protein